MGPRKKAPRRKAPAKRPAAAREPDSSGEEEAGAGGSAREDRDREPRRGPPRAKAARGQQPMQRGGGAVEAAGRPGIKTEPPERAVQAERIGGQGAARGAVVVEPPGGQGAVGPGPGPSAWVGPVAPGLTPSPALPPFPGWAPAPPPPAWPPGALPAAPRPCCLARCPGGRCYLGGAPRRAAEVAWPLGSHLSAATKEKILRGDYVDLFNLLNREREAHYEEEEEEGRHRVERVWENWLPAFLTYAHTMVEAHPCWALPLLQYLDLIHEVHLRSQGPAWLRYDEAFRQRAAHDPSLPWDSIHVQSWLFYVAPATPVEGERTDSGHLMPFAEPPHPSRVCWQFGTQGTCRWSPCKFEHRCSVCGGPHAFTACPKGRRARFWGRRRESPPPEEDYSD